MLHGDLVFLYKYFPVFFVPVTTSECNLIYIVRARPTLIFGKLK